MLNMQRTLVGLVGFLAVGCASTKQYVAIPNQSAIVENPEKARIYVLRPVSIGGMVPMEVQDGEIVVGETGPRGALCWERDPGPADITSHAENVDFLRIETEKGMVYYLLQKVKMGFFVARTKLELLMKDEGPETLQKCKLPAAVTSAPAATSAKSSLKSVGE